MPVNLSRSEAALLAACALLALIALLAPAVPQPADFHAFADRRTLWGVPYAMDVLSNLPFALAALAGAWVLWRNSVAITRIECAMAALFLAGLALTAAGSAWYHLMPDDAGLAVDRYAMSIAFAGLLGLGGAGRISERAGAALAVGLLFTAPFAVYVWSVTGNLLPWALVQGGGMVLVLCFALAPRRPGTLALNWFAVLLAYGVAKMFELGDHRVYEFTHHLVSGHTLKHVIAACAALPVLFALGAHGASVQNAPKIGERRTA